MPTKLNADGTIASDWNVELTGSKVEVFDDDVNTKLLSLQTTFYQPRDTTLKAANFVHMKQGIYEQLIMVKNDMDQDITINLIPQVGVGTLAYGPVAYTGIITKNGGRVFLATEVGENVANTVDRQIIAIPELRMPYYQFRMEITPMVAPTTGDIKFYVLRRY